MRFILLCVVLVLALPVLGAESIAYCARIESDGDRLACYDRAAASGGNVAGSETGTDATDSEAEDIDVDRDLAIEVEPVSVDETESLRDVVADDVDEGNGENQFMTSNHPNFFGIVTDRADGRLEDDTHLEFSVSLKYPYAGDLMEKWKERTRARADLGMRPVSWVLSRTLPDQLFFIYNATYDFYAFDSNRYQSAPIVSRHQNPGLLVAEWNLGTTDGLYTLKHKLRAGWFHESNGRSEEPQDAAEFSVLANEPGDNGLPKGDEYALAQISRGWDYLQLRYEVLHGDEKGYKHSGWWRAYVDLHLYNTKQFFLYDREDAVPWDVSLTEQPKIRDYDGLRFLHEVAFPGPRFLDSPLLLRTELKTGVSHREALSNLGGKISLITTLANTRVALFYFNGYGKEPSTYHLRTKYVGLGIELR